MPKTKPKPAEPTPASRTGVAGTSLHFNGNFRRYTNLPAVIHLLQNREIALVNPASWDDKNDAHFMAEYKRLRSAHTVLAICFAATKETYHHWRVFSPGADGVCLSLDRKAILGAFKKHPGITMGKMRYELVETVAGWPQLKISQLPFLKRKPYEPEAEFRVVYEADDKSLDFYNVAIKLSWIKTITLSPWMPIAFADSVKTALRQIDGCEDIPIVRSTLVGRGSWKALAGHAVE